MKKATLLLICATALTLLGSCQVKEKEARLKVMTFNIRYDNAGDSLNSWGVRKDTIAEFINREHPDIFGLQEVLVHQLHDLTEALPGYAHVGVGRDDGKEAGEFAPVFWDKQRFKLLDDGVFWLSQYPDSAGFIGWDGACTRLATWAKLQDNETGGEICFLNTHLDHVGKEAQDNGISLILQRLGTIAGNAQVIVTGDFNVNTGSEAYKRATAQPALLIDSYTAAKERTGVAYTYHDFDRIPEGERQKIDYILVSPTFEVLKEEITDEHTFGTLMSDHNPVIATLASQADASGTANHQ